MGGGMGSQLGPGIAGVATKYKGPSIKIYAERQKYQEWEFVYDPKDDPALKARMPQGQQVMGPGMNANPSNSGFSNTNNSGFSNTNNSGFSNTNNSGTSSQSGFTMGKGR